MKLHQEIYSSLYRQAYVSVEMGAGVDDARARSQRRQQAVNASGTAFIAANMAANKAAAATSSSSPIIISNRTSSLGMHASDENAFQDSAKGKLANTTVNGSDGPRSPAQESLAQTLTQEVERLKTENRDQHDTIRKLNSNLTNLKRNLEFKKEECVRLTSQVEQREQAIIDCQKRFEDEQLRYTRNATSSNDKCDAERLKLKSRIDSLEKQKEHLNKSLSEINIEKVSAFDQYHAESKKSEELETALHAMDDERKTLQRMIEQMKDEKLRREADVNEFVKTAKLQRKSFEAEINRLTAQGNRLVAQNSRRRTHIPAEDESKMVDAFYNLHGSVRCWSLDVIEALQAEDPGAELEFSKFPLGKKDARMSMSTNETQLLIAYVWEWLMRSIFGSDQCREIRAGQLFDLWSEEETARHLNFLEGRIFGVQKPGVAHEWRSFTVQCLAEKVEAKELTRIEKVMEEVSSWFLKMSNLDKQESKEVIDKLLEVFETTVVIPAIEFSKILRQRFTPILLKTPELLEDAVENWYKVQFDEGGKGPELDIVIRPQLCKENIDIASGERSKTEILVEVERFKMVDLNDSVEISSSNSSEGKDHEMSG